jgi:cytochrome c2
VISPSDPQSAWTAKHHNTSASTDFEVTLIYLKILALGLGYRFTSSRMRGTGRSMKRRNAMRWLLGLGLLLTLVVLAVRGGQGRFCVLTDDAAHGRELARNICTAACHNISPADDLKDSNPGPNLQNVYMSLAGTTPAPLDPTGVYHHPSPPLAAARDAGIVWTDDNLVEYLNGPKAFLDSKTGQHFKNTLLYMPFFIGEESERRSAVAYLKAIKGHPECD